MTLNHVLNIRKENNISFSPVFDENQKLLGIITHTSILNVLTDIMPESEVY
jgi:CBS domain-containing protein